MTSVLPHLLLQESADALLATDATRVVVLNLVPQPGETDNFSQEQYLSVLRRYAPDFRIDVVVAHTGAVALPQRLERAVQRLGAELVIKPIGDPFGRAAARSGGAGDGPGAGGGGRLGHDRAEPAAVDTSRSHDRASAGQGEHEWR